MNTCANLKCNVEIPTDRKFCSLSCTNVGRSRRGSKKIHNLDCANNSCNKKFDTTDKRRLYCSKSCAAHVNNRVYKKRNQSNPTSTCNNSVCDNTVSRGHYCSRSCRQLHEEEQYELGILDGNAKYSITAYARRYILKRSEGRCEGYDDRIPGRCTETRVIQIDHIDGNWRNSIPANLRALCPTCHALTDTYGGKNRGSGRTWKQNYSQFKPMLDTSGD